MVCENCQGGWEFQTEKSPLPVKLVVKQMAPSDWIVACMVPRGNMMHCLLKEIEGAKNLVQAKFNITAKEVPNDIMEAETDMKEFLQSGITDLSREGDSLIVRAGDRGIAFTAN